MKLTLGNRATSLAIVAGLLGLAVIACQQKLPTAPSDLTNGIAIYQHANFLGDSSQVANDISDLDDFRGPCEHERSDTYGTTTYRDWNDCMSSIRAAPGWRATVYRDPNFRGESLEVIQDVPNLQLVPGTCSHDGLNDCISSIRVRRP